MKSYLQRSEKGKEMTNHSSSFQEVGNGSLSCKAAVLETSFEFHDQLQLHLHKQSRKLGTEV